MGLKLAVLIYFDKLILFENGKMVWLSFYNVRYI